MSKKTDIQTKEFSIIKRLMKMAILLLQSRKACIHPMLSHASMYLIGGYFMIFIEFQKIDRSWCIAAAIDQTLLTLSTTGKVMLTITPLE